MTTTAAPIRRCNVATGSGDPVLAPAHWLGQHVAVTPPCDKARQFPTVRGQWVITHRATGMSAATLHCSKRQAVAIARQWDQRIGLIDPTDATTWPWREQWGNLVRSINYPTWRPDREPADSTATAGELAARAGLAIDQSMPRLHIQWRGKFWPAPSDSELELWTFDSVAETPDGRTVEPDAPDSWLSILRLI